MKESPQKGPRASDISDGLIGAFSVFLVLTPELIQLEPEVLRLIGIFDYIFCAYFFSHFVRRLFVSTNRIKYLSTWGILDFASSIPVIDSLRYARIFRIVRVFRLLRGLKALTAAVRSEPGKSLLTFGGAIWICGIVLATLAVLHFELRDPSALIRTADDALWWALVTITTVGYGDLAPVTGMGRLFASILMVLGIGVFGVVAGLSARLFIKKN